jgi:hypothetical protein
VKCSHPRKDQNSRHNFCQICIILSHCKLKKSCKSTHYKSGTVHIYAFINRNLFHKHERETPDDRRVEHLQFHCHTAAPPPPQSLHSPLMSRVTNSPVCLQESLCKVLCPGFVDTTSLVWSWPCHLSSPVTLPSCSVPGARPPAVEWGQG